MGITCAEIAQLVEHNLAKVGVASSSLVFRSSFRHSFFHSIHVSEAVRFLTHFYNNKESVQDEEDSQSWTLHLFNISLTSS